MSGHEYFKYRLELPYYAFTADNGGHDTAYRNRAAKFFEYIKVLTELYGYGPAVDDAGMYHAACKEKPKWGFRPLDNHRTYTLYFKDDDVKDQIEKLLVFMQLQQS